MKIKRSELVEYVMLDYYYNKSFNPQEIIYYGFDGIDNWTTEELLNWLEDDIVLEEIDGNEFDVLEISLEHDVNNGYVELYGP